MFDLFDPSNQKPKTRHNIPLSDRLTSNVIVLVFFYFAIGTGILFAIHFLLPFGATSKYFMAFVSLSTAFWLFNKFQRRT